MELIEPNQATFGHLRREMLRWLQVYLVFLKLI
jgi:hypothetical protein